MKLVMLSGMALLAAIGVILIVIGAVAVRLLFKMNGAYGNQMSQDGIRTRASYFSPNIFTALR